jgi:uncharacterized protein (TIGR02246 family)
MAGKTPQETMRRLIAAFNAGDVDQALTLYHPDATFVSDPGTHAAGKPAIRAALDAFLASRPTLTIDRQETIEAGDVALHCTQWLLVLSGSGGEVTRKRGKGAVVLRRQPDGSWLIAVENPWGTDLVK